MMKIVSNLRLASIFALGLVLLIGTILCSQQFTVASNGNTNDNGKSGSNSTDEKWTDSFSLNNCTFSSNGSNQYFILKPGYQTVYEGVDEGIDVSQTITVLNETKIINGIDTRIIEEKSMDIKSGMEYEVSRNYFALCKETNSIFYFGEDVNFYDNGKLANHSGTWHDGVDNSKAGLMMPGMPLVGARYYQESAPKVAIDRAEIVSLSETVDTPAGKFENCLKEKDTDGLDPEEVAYRYYAPGIGQVRDDKLNLIRYGYLK
jgi:hypothetical protein